MWDLIPVGVDILVTHSPPKGVGRLSISDTNVDGGCAALIEAVKRIKPVVHVFGHIHAGYGVLKQHPTTFINAAMMNKHYKPVNKPVVFDIL